MKKTETMVEIQEDKITFRKMKVQEVITEVQSRLEEVLSDKFEIDIVNKCVHYAKIENAARMLVHIEKVELDRDLARAALLFYAYDSIFNTVSSTILRHLKKEYGVRIRQEIVDEIAGHKQSDLKEAFTDTYFILCKLIKQEIDLDATTAYNGGNSARRGSAIDFDLDDEDEDTETKEERAKVQKRVESNKKDNGVTYYGKQSRLEKELRQELDDYGIKTRQYITICDMVDMVRPARLRAAIQKNNPTMDLPDSTNLKDLITLVGSKTAKEINHPYHENLMVIAQRISDGSVNTKSLLAMTCEQLITTYKKVDILRKVKNRVNLSDEEIKELDIVEKLKYTDISCIDTNITILASKNKYSEYVFNALNHNYGITVGIATEFMASSLSNISDGDMQFLLSKIERLINSKYSRLQEALKENGNNLMEIVYAIKDATADKLSYSAILNGVIEIILEEAKPLYTNQYDGEKLRKILWIKDTTAAFKKFTREIGLKFDGVPQSCEFEYIVCMSCKKLNEIKRRG